jgi:hypothetical protein
MRYGESARAENRHHRSDVTDLDVLGIVRKLFQFSRLFSLSLLITFFLGGGEGKHDIAVNNNELLLANQDDTYLSDLDGDSDLDDLDDDGLDPLPPANGCPHSAGGHQCSGKCMRSGCGWGWGWLGAWHVNASVR